MQHQTRFTTVLVVAVSLIGAGVPGCSPRMGVDSPHPVYTFPELDRDNNQLVTREEFLDLYTEATVSDFQKIDRDDSGTIDPQEWERFLEQHREPEPEYRSRQLIPHMRGPVYDPTTPPFPE